jgi:hypothetical protein
MENMVFLVIRLCKAENPDISEEHIAFIFLLGLHFDHEDGGNMLLRKFGLSPHFKALQSRRP